MDRIQLEEVVRNLQARLDRMENKTFREPASVKVRVDQAARELGVSPRTVRNHVEAGLLTGIQYRVRGTLWVTRDSLDRLKSRVYES